MDNMMSIPVSFLVKSSDSSHPIKAPNIQPDIDHYGNDTNLCGLNTESILFSPSEDPTSQHHKRNRKLMGNIVRAVTAVLAIIVACSLAYSLSRTKLLKFGDNVIL